MLLLKNRVSPQLSAAVKCDLVINTTDSGYTHAAYLSPLFKEKELVCISRFRHGVKGYTCAKENNSGGAKKIYGECFYLSETYLIN
jgi:hypothetical protein